MASRSSEKPSAKKPRTHAASPLRDSASISSQSVRMYVEDLVKRNPLSLSPDDCASYKLYTLEEVLGSAGLSVVMSANKKETSDQACCRYVTKKVSIRYSCECTKMVQALKDIPPLFCTLKQFPDVMVFKPGEPVMPKLPVLTVEVHSSPFQYTIMKCIIGVLDQLRLYRSYDPRIVTCTGFAFPKLNIKQCVVKVQVTFAKLRFQYMLTAIDVIEEIDLLTTADTASMPSSYDCQTPKFVVSLSTDDLMYFGSGAEQMPSTTSTLVKCGHSYYKHPFKANITLLWSLSFTDNPLRITLFPEKKGDLFFFRYEAVHYDPLTAEDAYKCLREFVQCLHATIKAFHNEGYAHLDIRLENVCFDEHFRPILVDLDRSVLIEDGADSYESSCMYRSGKTGNELDYIQLGWLIAWVVEPGSDYHGRVCLPKKYKTDPFLIKLISEGKQYHLP